MARDRSDDRDDRDDRGDDRPRRRQEFDEYDRPRRRRDRDDDTPPKKDVSVLGIFGLIASCVALLMSFIPFLGMFACIPGGIALLKSGIALIIAKVSQGRVGTGIPLTGTIISGIAILISILQIVAIVVFAATRPPSPTTSLSTPADVTITAEQLDAAYDDNVVAADAKYKGKLIDVTGVVERVADLRRFRLTVELTGIEDSTVDCDFGTADKASLSALKAGSTVTIRGRCAGRKTVDGTKWVTLENCTVIPPGTPKPTDATNPGTKVTATQLRKEYIDDPAKAASKYRDRVVDVSGQVTGIDRSTPDAVVGLGVGKMGEVQCVFSAKDAATLATLKEGQQVTIRGTCVGNEDALAFVTVKDCTVVK